MNRFWFAFVMVLLLAGCSLGPTESAAQPARSVSEPPVGQVTAPPAFAAEKDVCVKPDDTSGIIVDFRKDAGHGTWRVKPGWAVALRALPMSVYLQFPRQVDTQSVHVKVEPPYWQVAEWEYGGAPDTGYIFRLLPGGQRNSVDGTPGWVSLTVESARTRDGSPMKGVPFTVKFFAYNPSLADTYPYLAQCHGSLVVRSDP